VANVPSRAATAHSITVPLRRYGLHRPATKEGTDGALFPVRSQWQFDRASEGRFADWLEKLEDDYLCCSNVPFEPKAPYTDFVVLHRAPRHPRPRSKEWKFACRKWKVLHGLRNKYVPLSLLRVLGEGCRMQLVG